MAILDVRGKTVVLTGTFAMKREEAEAALTARGARVTGSISAKTDILFAGDKAGSKRVKAKALKISVYDEAALRAVLASAPKATPATEPVGAPTGARAAKKPATQRATGGRVTFRYFAEGGRGEVLGWHEAPPSYTTKNFGTRFALVRCDEGSVAWIPGKYLRARAKVDAYERLRDPAFDFASAARFDVRALLAEITRAIGPNTGYTSELEFLYAGNGRRAAGLLSRRPFRDAVAIVVELCRAAAKTRLDLKEWCPIKMTGDEFAAKELGRGEYLPLTTLEGLFSGLMLLARHSSAREQKKANALLDDATLVELATIPLAEAFAKALARDKVLAAPRWHIDRDAEAVSELALPDDAPAYLGTGH